jgi:hypothetical protein
LDLSNEKLVSKFAFKRNLYRYNEVAEKTVADVRDAMGFMVGRCKLNSADP